MDILLQMDLPEFRLENMGRQPQWHDITAIAGLEQGSARAFQVDDKTIFVHALNGSIHVYDNRCPHRGTLIGADRLDNCRLTCPGHQWQFDLRTGECVAIGNLPLTQLEHKVADGRLLVYW
jgi:nitrite reductase/ring-hydroxylating ferredoxin subunit